MGKKKRPRDDQGHDPRSQRTAEPPAGSRVRFLLIGLPALLLLTLAAVYSTTHMNPGVDTWISLASGRHILAHGVDDVDPFSFNSRPSAAASETGGLWNWLHPTGWINQNWLSNVVLQVLAASMGRDAMVVWKLINILVVAGLLVLTARQRDAPWVLALACAAAALIAARDFFEIRAQEFTNLSVAALFLVLALAARRDPLWVWCVVPLFAVWANLHGGFIYGFMVLALLLAAELVRFRVERRSGAVSAPRLAHVLGASAAAVFVTVACSPYRLANLTHTAAVTISGDAALWRSVSEWQPLFSEGPGDPTAFVVLAFLTLLAMVLAWLRFASEPQDTPRPRAAERPGEPRSRLEPWAVVVVLVTFAMAVQSRRFVSVASLVAAPFLAGWLADAFAGGRLTRWWSANGRRPAIAAALLWLIVAGAGGVLVARIQRIFVEPWPASFEQTSVFDRLTHSYRRPWGVCTFLTINQVQGRIWNPWEEGGFLADCQSPGPDGRLPVEIFIDGRAQRAYDVTVVTDYLDLRNGGPAGADAARQGGRLSDEQLKAAMSWIDTRLVDLGVDLVYLPAGEQRTTLAATVFNSPSWRAVYLDDSNILFADTRSPVGIALAQGMDGGSIRYPDEFSRLLTGAFTALRSGQENDLPHAIDLTQQALAARPSATAVGFLVRSAATAPLRLRAEAILREYADDLLTRRHQYALEDGYGQRLLAAIPALTFLRDALRERGDQVGAKKRATELAELKREVALVERQILW